MLRVRVTVLLLLTSACLVDVNGGIEDGQSGGTTNGGAGEGGTGATGLGGATGGQGGTAAAGGAGGEGGSPNGGGGMGGVGGMPVTCTELEFDGNDRAVVSGIGSEAPTVTLRGSFVPASLATGSNRNVLLVRPEQFHLSVSASGTTPMTNVEFLMQSLLMPSCVAFFTFANIDANSVFEFEATIGPQNNVVQIGGSAGGASLPGCLLPVATNPNTSLFVGDWDGPPTTAPNFIPKPFVGSINLLKAGGSQCVQFDASVASAGVDPIPSASGSGCTLGLDLEDDPNNPVLLCQ